MNFGSVANECKRANRDIGASVSPTGEVAATKDKYMKSVQGLQ
jgi:hypothetical protein